MVVFPNKIYVDKLNESYLSRDFVDNTLTPFLSKFNITDMINSYRQRIEANRIAYLDEEDEPLTLENILAKTSSSNYKFPFKYNTSIFTPNEYYPYSCHLFTDILTRINKYKNMILDAVTRDELRNSEEIQNVLKEHVLNVMDVCKTELSLGYNVVRQLSMFYIINDSDEKTDVNCPFDNEKDIYNVLYDTDTIIQRCLKGESHSLLDDNEDDISLEFLKDSDKLSDLYKLCSFIEIIIANYICEQMLDAQEIAINLIEQTDGYMYIQIHDYVNIYKSIMDDERKHRINPAPTVGYTDEWYAVEATPVHDNSVSDMDNVKISDIDSEYKSKWIKMNKAFIQIFKINPAKNKIMKEAKFFRKYYGRIPHVFDKYANEAYVYENVMKVDPAEVLETTVVEVMNKMGNSATGLFDELVNIANKISSAVNNEARLSFVKNYCRKFPIENIDDPVHIKAQILNETHFRIAESILQDIKVYGFTVEGIVENKKFPPANHIITSIFVDNLHESPEKQPVSNIFKSADSILIFGKPERLLRFTNVFRDESTKVLQSYNPKVAATSRKNIELSYSRMVNGFRNGDTEENEMDPKLQKKIMKAIETGICDSVDLAIDQKKRILQCMGVANGMVKRVSTLARTCIVALLNVEHEKTDKSGRSDAYDSGRNTGKNRSINRKLNQQRIRSEGKSEADIAKSKRRANAVRNFFEV